MSDVKETIKTMSELLKATGNYVYFRLGSDKEREAYKDATSAAITYLDSGIESVDILRTRILSLEDEVEHLFKKTLFSSKDAEIRAYRLGINNAIDIVNNLEKRFITGGGDMSPRVVKHISEYSSDKKVF